MAFAIHEALAVRISTDVPLQLSLDQIGQVHAATQPRGRGQCFGLRQEDPAVAPKIEPDWKQPQVMLFVKLNAIQHLLTKGRVVRFVEAVNRRRQHAIRFGELANDPQIFRMQNHRRIPRHPIGVFGKCPAQTSQRHDRALVVSAMRVMQDVVAARIGVKEAGEGNAPVRWLALLRADDHICQFECFAGIDHLFGGFEQFQRGQRPSRSEFNVRIF